MHKADGRGLVKHYGYERLLISLEGKLYQAGENLAENLNQLETFCKFKIEKVHKNSTRHVRNAIYSIFEKGGLYTWIINFKKVRILKQDDVDGKTCIIDARTVIVKR